VCDNATVSSFAACVSGNSVCSNHGLCTISGACACDDGFVGTFCESVTASGSSSDTVLAAVLGSVIPAAFIVAVAVLVAGVAVAWRRWQREKEDEWEVDMEELEIAEELGAGGFGTVHKAEWKGTEVAVKTLITTATSASMREVERSFKEEVRVMTALRHPNVVLFMAACTKPPKMCIVMEFMALGSLFEVPAGLTSIHCHSRRCR
jgi:hypothetical protein